MATHSIHLGQVASVEQIIECQQPGLARGARFKTKVPKSTWISRWMTPCTGHLEASTSQPPKPRFGHNNGIKSKFQVDIRNQKAQNSNL
jgi:hypothetical protein